MRKGYKYRIYPTKKQETLLEQTLALCCELYNGALQERKDAYKTRGISITYNNQQNQQSDIKKDLTLSDRVYRCDNTECKLEMDRDLNASINILALGLQSVGSQSIEAASL